jgi:hypothetical protein
MNVICKQSIDDALKDGVSGSMEKRMRLVYNSCDPNADDF